MKELIKKIIPASVLSLYHKSLAILADMYYQHPSDKLIVIGVTGTKGKTTTCNVLWHLLESAGHKTGMTTTSNFRIHNKQWFNKTKMTMLGRFQLQKMLKDMVKAGCEYAVIETSSEGIKQWRHIGINYDMAFFLNLSPEHIEAHGGFENYKKAKAELFKAITKKPKRINKQDIKKIIFANVDDESSEYYLKFPAEVKVTYGQKDGANIIAKNLQGDERGITWQINGVDFYFKQLGKFNIYNALPAVALGLELGMSLPRISEIISGFMGMPGRMELIDEGQDFKVIVDYCYEPKSLEAALQTIKQIYIKPELNNKIICVSGPTGGGRDTWRRPVMGELLSKYCRYTIITTDEPYNDDPSKIADDMIRGFKDQNKKLDQDYFKILDRKEAIKKAFALAHKDDVVLLAGLGSSTVIAVGNKGKAWDDRQVVRELLQ